ncbi:MAG: VWA domain-containing protein, partial [Rhodobacterales bacterium]
MTDDLDDLRELLKAAPAPDADAKARAIALAMENYDRLQGSTDASRSSEDRQSPAAPLNGVRRMLNFLTSRPALAVSTSAAALLVGVMVILPTADLRLPGRASLPTADAPQAPTPKIAAPEAADTGLAANTGAAPAELARNVEADSLSSVAEAEPMADAEVVELAEESSVLPAAPAGSIADARTRMEAVPEGGTVGYLLPEATIALTPDLAQPQLEDTEAYANAPANPVKVTADEPVSTFSIDVDTASWAVIRSTLNMGVLPTPDQVRIEEMVNYFPYAYAAPEGEAAFASTISVMPTPWNPGTRLVTIGIQGAMPEVAARPPLNLVFLIDTSGSMEDASKLPLLKQSLSLMLSELRPEDQVSIVTYAGSAGLVLPPTAAKDRTTILASLENLMAGGSTAGAEGLELAYQVAEGMKAEGEVTRILLATDGDFNVGVSDPEGLEAYVAKQRETGTYLSVLGFGRGNLDDAVMQSLAQNGNGTAAYIDTLSEARKVLVDQLTGALFPIADDVKIQVEWNPAAVAE